jgi:hypothetical protein
MRCPPLQATLPLPGYLSRLGVVFLAACLLLSGPVAAQTFDPFEQVYFAVWQQSNLMIGCCVVSRSSKWLCTPFCASI